MKEIKPSLFRHVHSHLWFTNINIPQQREHNTGKLIIIQQCQPHPALTSEVLSFETEIKSIFLYTNDKHRPNILTTLVTLSYWPTKHST